MEVINKGPFKLNARDKRLASKRKLKPLSYSGIKAKIKLLHSCLKDGFGRQLRSKGFDLCSIMENGFLGIYFDCNFKCIFLVK